MERACRNMKRLHEDRMGEERRGDFVGKAGK